MASSTTTRSIDFGALRVLIAHDWIVAWAGSERCVEQLLEVFPQADLVVGVLADSMRDFNAVTRRARETWLSRIPGARAHHRWFLPLEGLAFRTVDTRRYDLVISSSHAFAKMIPRPKNGVHLCYCYSPPRYLWDLRTTYHDHAPTIESLVLKWAGGPLRWWDKRAARGVDHFVGISQVAADRIRRSYGRSAAVVYPPVSGKLGGSAPGSSRDEFLLCLGRLVAYKRVDLAIAAAQRLGLRLVVAGDGPERARLERLGGPGTEFLGHVSEAQAGSLLSRCRLFLFCGEEDFGITPLEANAHGAPVVYLRRGGAAETMRPRVTGIPFDEPSPNAVAEAIGTACGTTWSAELLRANAARYSPQQFREGIAAVLRRVFGKNRRGGERVG